MNLIENYSSLPKGRPNFETYAQTDSGDLRYLGRSPRLTWGEKLLGRYSKFYQIDMNDKTTTTSLEPRSGTGRYRFQIRIEVDFKVRDCEAIIAGGGDVDQQVLLPMRRDAETEAAHFDAEDYLALATRLTDILDPGGTGERSRGPFDIIHVVARVDPPEGKRLADEDLETTRGLDLRIAASLARGDHEEAEHMRAARREIEQLKHQKARELLTRAEYVAEIEKRIEDLVAQGAKRNSEAVKALEASRDDYAVENAPKKRLEDKTGETGKDEEPEDLN